MSSSDEQKIFGAHLPLFLLFTNQYHSYSYHHPACQNTPPPHTTLRLLPNSCSYLRVPPPSQACRYFRNAMGHSFYQGGPGRSELQLMFRLMTLDFRGRIHLSLTAQSRSQVSQVHILHISSHLVSLYHQGTERGRMRHLDASLSPLSVKGASATTSGHQNFVELLLSKMNPNLYYLYTFSRSIYEYVE